MASYSELDAAYLLLLDQQGNIAWLRGPTDDQQAADLF